MFGTVVTSRPRALAISSISDRHDHATPVASRRRRVERRPGGRGAAPLLDRERVGLEVRHDRRAAPGGSLTTSPRAGLRGAGSEGRHGGERRPGDLVAGAVLGAGRALGVRRAHAACLVCWFHRWR